MTRMRSCLLVLALVLLGGTARADLIWSYNVVQGYDFPLQNLHPAADSNGISSTPSGRVEFVGSQTNGIPQDGSGRILLGTWNALLHFADSGDIGPQPYRLNLKLTDQASDQSGTLTFQGTLQGEFANGPLLSNTYVGPTTGSLLLGSNRYTVSLEPAPAVGGIISIGLDPTIYVPFDGDGTTKAYADVTMTPATAPEPSSLVLALLGAAGGLLGWWRRRRTL